MDGVESSSDTKRIASAHRLRFRTLGWVFAALLVVALILSVVMISSVLFGATALVLLGGSFMFAMYNIFQADRCDVRLFQLHNIGVGSYPPEKRLMHTQRACIGGAAIFCWFVFWSSYSWSEPSLGFTVMMVAFGFFLLLWFVLLVMRFLVAVAAGRRDRWKDRLLVLFTMFGIVSLVVMVAPSLHHIRLLIEQDQFDTTQQILMRACDLQRANETASDFRLGAVPSTPFSVSVSQVDCSAKGFSFPAGTGSGFFSSTTWGFAFSTDLATPISSARLNASTTPLGAGWYRWSFWNDL
jgi:hypothetical protein